MSIFFAWPYGSWPVVKNHLDSFLARLDTPKKNPAKRGVFFIFCINEPNQEMASVAVVLLRLEKNTGKPTRKATATIYSTPLIWV